jgi:hypothetical protein
MIRSIAVLALFAAGLGTATAQETPAAPSAPADVVVNPAAPIDATPKQANLLTGMYATKAVIEICNISLEDGIINGMNVDQKRLETSLAMDVPTAEKAYAQVKADVEKTTPDCAEGSADRAGVDAVANIYKASDPAAGTTGAAPAAPEPATPAPAATPAQ